MLFLVGGMLDETKLRDASYVPAVGRGSERTCLAHRRASHPSSASLHVAEEFDGWDGTMTGDESGAGTAQFLDWAGKAVEGTLCVVSTCTARPVTKRNGRALGKKHQEHYDYSTMGDPCEHCGSRQWVETPEAKSVAFCAICDFVTYDQEVVSGSW